MVAQNMLRTYEIKWVFSEFRKKIGFDNSFDVAFNKSKYLIYFICAYSKMSNYLI